ncbi:hypothetical protein JTB14_038127 [Gonioctena quinquepunctata]|nr:hypothetical protein JTB14_038127 [Gonioctena quinquepunctata]
MEKPPQDRHLVFLVLDKTRKVDKNFLRLARERNDDYGRAIIERLAAGPDSRAADAQYHFSCMKDLNIPSRKGNPPTGDRPRDEVDDVMQSIFEYLENSSDESQFTIGELMNGIAPISLALIQKLSKTTSLRSMAVIYRLRIKFLILCAPRVLGTRLLPILGLLCKWVLLNFCTENMDHAGYWM